MLEQRPHGRVVCYSRHELGRFTLSDKLPVIRVTGVFHGNMKRSSLAYAKCERKIEEHWKG